MYQYKARVFNVVDGDTFDAEIYLGFSIKVEYRFRVSNLDTPETYRPRNIFEKEHGMKAKERAKELLLNKEVVINSTKTVGIYGRYGAVITLQNGCDFAEIMRAEGFEKLENYDG